MKNSKIPLLPLFIADALIFVFVFACATSTLSSGEPMSSMQTFACCLAVLIGMFLMLVPYFLEYKKDLAQKHEHTEEARKNFEIIFDELAALRLALADLVERVENDEDKIAPISSLEKSSSDLKRDIKKLAADFTEARANDSDKIEKLEIAQRNTKNVIDKISDDIKNLAEKIDSLNVANTQQSQSESDEDIIEDETSYKQPKRAKSKIEVGHLLKRALTNAEDTKQSVEKFLARANANATEQNENEDYEKSETTERAERGQDFVFMQPQMPAEDEYDNLESSETIVKEQENIEDAPQAPNSDESKNDDPDFFEDADSPQDVESAENVEQTDAVSDSLFDDLPISRGKIKPKRGDAVITVNALIGIGNKPFLRGDGAGLSPDKGIPMDYMEIGKWRYVLPEFDTPLNFSILKNDLTPPTGESKFTINSGEKLELNLLFPIEQELF